MGVEATATRRRVFACRVDVSTPEIVEAMAMILAAAAPMEQVNNRRVQGDARPHRSGQIEGCAC